ncbi:lactonase family protein [Rhodohalobacter sulfatireducens]|nr:lactonase family protein [Rhodohalobacter sulfatireducens]
MDEEKGKTVNFFVGSYSDEGPYVLTANGDGILSCTLDLKTGNIQKNSLCEEGVNATYLDKSPNEKYLFAAIDRFSEIGSVSVFSIGSNGSLSQLSTQPSHGKSTCHIASDRNGERIFLSSYMDSKLTAYNFDGSEISPATEIITYEGSGPNVERQEDSHAHQAVVSPDNKWLYVCDLGSDKIWIHDMADLENIIRSIDVPPGYGPRHLVWNEPLNKSYVYCELNSHILVYDWDQETGNMSLIEDIAALPEEYEGQAAGSAIRIHPNHKALYVSDRGHNSIIVHSIGESGKLKYESWFSIRGKTPRDFAVDPTGTWLLVANQDTDSIVPFRLDDESGLPVGEYASSFECGTPVSIQFLTP